MQRDYPQDQNRVLLWLICAIVAAFFLEMALIKFGAGQLVAQGLVFSATNLFSGKVWTLLSYSFLHSPSNLLHVVFSVIGVYFLGRELLASLGTKSFLILYGFGAVTGALAWLAINYNTLNTLLGASASISALFVVFALRNPDRPITILLLFIPVTFPKTKYLAWGIIALDLAGMLFMELGDGHGLTAHSAHLGGYLAGYLFHLQHSGHLRLRFTAPWKQHQAEAIPPAWIGKTRATGPATPVFKVNLTDREHLKAEVDRILDKINSKGFASLTPEEKKTLDDARDLLSKN